MRLRIQTQNPLAELKAWFIPDVPSAPTTIYELKEALCDRVQTFKEDGRCEAQSLVLLLDDFELLDNTPFSAVRDGDLLCIKLSTAAQVVNEKGRYNGTQMAIRSKKRKRAESPQRPLSFPSQSVKKPRAGPSVPKKQHATKQQHQEESSSDSDSEESSDKSSSSSSEEASDSDSSSSSSTSSSSASSSSSTSASSPPTPAKTLTSKATTKKPSQAPTTVRKLDTSITHIPPGYGKPSTHSRNQRRKKKREHEKVLVTAMSQPPPAPAPPKGVSSTNAVPLGSSPTPAAVPTAKKPSVATSPSQTTPTPIQIPTASVQITNASSSSASAVAPTAILVSSAPSNLPAGPTPMVAPKKRLRTTTQRDRAGPASDVAFALNQAFGQNARAGEYKPGRTRDVVADEDEDGEPDVEVIDIDALDGGSSSKAAKGKGKKAEANGGGGAGAGYVTITPDQVMMSSLRNKNKKKGFKQSMAGPIPQKIVFGSDSTPAGPSGSGFASAKDPVENEDKTMDVDVDEPGNDSLTYPPSEGAASASAPTPTRRPRLIPPSEIQARGELPLRVFVTSVDVEAGMWDDTNYQHGNTASGSGSGNSKKNKKKRKAQSQDQHKQGTYQGYDEDKEYQDQDWDPDQGDSAAAVEASLVLEYPDEDGYSSTPNPTPIPPSLVAARSGTPTANKAEAEARDGFDWARAEKMFEESKLVRNADELVVGGVVGWKTLDIDPATFTPENMLFLARVVNLLPLPPDANQGKEKATVLIKRIPRSQVDAEVGAYDSGASRAALAFGLQLNAADGMEDGEEGGGQEEKEEPIEWDEIVSLQWRILEL